MTTAQPNNPSPPRRRQTALVLREYTPPGQDELLVLSNALDAALGYSPLRHAPAASTDAYALVTRLVETRFWDDVYVDRPEMRRLLAELDKGQIVVITGERGTGKSTAIQAAVRHLEADAVGGARNSTPLPVVFDANRYGANLATKESASTTIHRTVYDDLYAQAIASPKADGGAPMTGWLSYLYEHDSAFQALQMSLGHDGLWPSDPADWHTVADMPEYTDIVREGYNQFARATGSDQLRRLLAYLDARTDYAVLLVIDNVDHLSNEVQIHSAEVLSTIIASSSGRVRGAIAVRPENYEPIQSALDTAPRPPQVALNQKPWFRSVLTKPSEDLTLKFIERRLALLQNPATVDAIIGCIPSAKAESLAEAAALPGHTSAQGYFEVLSDLLHYIVYDVFRTDEVDPELSRDNASFVQYIHLWHNGSLRECARSLVVFVEDILQNKTHMYQLHDLMVSVVASQNEPVTARRFKLRRIARSLLYRHLLFWGSSDGVNPPENVMVFDAVEEDTKPPLYFLRLRILQYLAHRDGRRTTVADVRKDFAKLGVNSDRIDELLRLLSVRRTRDDSGLIRVDNAPSSAHQALPSTSEVKLLDAGRFLVNTLCLTTEYLFWSAVSPRVSERQRNTPKRMTDKDVQRDSFRAEVAADFLETDVVGRFREEHPYLTGLGGQWDAPRARERILLYGRLFGFTRHAWFLDRCCRMMAGFIPKHAQHGEYESARGSIERIRAFTTTLDRLVAQEP